MALITHNLFGEVTDKVRRAKQIARSFCPPEGYIMADSGGKDSRVVRAILDMAGVPYEAHYSVTTVDPPELVRFLIRLHEAVIYDMPDGTHKYFTVHKSGKLLRLTDASAIVGMKAIHFDIPEMSMRKLIIRKQMPPTRLQRYCCEYLKESANVGRITVTGVRAHESANRKKNQGAVTVFDGETGRKFAEELGANFSLTVRGGLYLTMMTMPPAARWKIATEPARLLSIRSSTLRKMMCGNLSASTKSLTVPCTTKDTDGWAA